MAGTRHHYVPRWLQAGFADKGAKKNSRTWVYSKKFNEPRWTVTANVGVEGHFYAYGSGVDRRNADEPMTSAEGSLFVPLALRLFEGPVGPVQEVHSEISDFLAHIEVRTKGFRDYLSTACKPLAALLVSFLQNPKLFRPYLAQLVAAQPEFFQEVFAQANMSVSPEELNSLLSSDVQEQYSAAEQLVHAGFTEDGWVRLFRVAMKAGHVEALLAAVVSDGRKRQYAGHRFSLLEFPLASFVQGDSPLVFRMTDGQYTTFVVGEDQIDFAFLPLTSTRLLVAERTGTCLPDWQELRKASIACAQDYFIAAQKAGDLVELLPLVGTKSPHIDATVVEGWMQGALQEALTGTTAFEGPVGDIVIGLFQGEMSLPKPSTAGIG